ncbi:DsbA family protein [uncultured Proteiniphilum sp.]|uniref:DsbA family protein n=1 Tax=uncultured Proteiniphilum sp. TaxID=497637 RepID=UPI00344C3F32
MNIEIWSDVMCPFCYIGKRNFETALSQFKDSDHIKVSWKSFQWDTLASEKAAGHYFNNFSMAVFVSGMLGCRCTP